MDLANWNWKVVREFGEKRFGIELCRSSCLNYLHRLGFVIKRPKKQPRKAGPIGARLIHDGKRRRVFAPLRLVGRLGNVSDFLELDLDEEAKTITKLRNSALRVSTPGELTVRSIARDGRANHYRPKRSDTLALARATVCIECLVEDVVQLFRKRSRARHKAMVTPWELQVWLSQAGRSRLTLDENSRRLGHG